MEAQLPLIVLFLSIRNDSCLYEKLCRKESKETCTESSSSRSIVDRNELLGKDGKIWYGLTERIILVDHDSVNATSLSRVNARLSCWLI